MWVGILFYEGVGVEMGSIGLGRGWLIMGRK